MTDTTEEALLAACVEHPAELDPALRLADWYQEQGDDVRAKFVRTQCAVTDWADPELCHFGACRCDTCTAYATWNRLLREHEAEWRQAGACPKCGENPPEFPLQRGAGTFRACSGCNYTGDVGALVGKCGPCEGSGHGFSSQSTCVVCNGTGWTRKVEFRRGLLDCVHARFNEVFYQDVWQQTGDVAWAPSAGALAWVRHFPVTRIVLTDAKPLFHMGRLRSVFGWAGGNYSGTTPYHMPQTVFNELNWDEADYSDHSHGYTGWKTCERAIKELAIAAAKAVRKHLTPPPSK